MLARILTVAFTLGVFHTLSPGLSAQPAGTLAPAVEQAPAPAAKPRPLPFQGRVQSVNKAEGTFTIRTKEGKDHVFHLTPDTKIEKAEAPATIDDIAPDEIVRGSRIKLADFKWEARRVIIGAKEPGEGGGRRKRK